MREYAVFILSYKRSENIKTLHALEKGNYTGETYIICGNDDPTLDSYREKYRDRLIVFDKYKYMETVDTIDNRHNKDCVVYARHAVFDIARELGLQYFIVLDDDYSYFESRYESGGSLKHHMIVDLDKAFSATFDFLRETDAEVVAWDQGGDFIGGICSSEWGRQLGRKVMNTFFCRTDRPLDFVGSTNEDVNYYVTANMQGRKLFSIANADVQQTDTQQNSGGLTDIYKRDGTYIKSFYSVICQPSCVKLAMMGAGHSRIHHNIDWNSCAPKILNERHKKIQKLGGAEGGQKGKSAPAV